MSSDTNGDTGAAVDKGIARRSVSRNPLVEWVLVDGNRILLTFVLCVGVFGGLVVFQRLSIVAFTDPDSVTRMASGMIAGSFSLVTIVVSVNQLILSQEFSPAGQFRDRFESVMEFRRDVEDAASVPASPAAPTRLLELLTTNIRHSAEVLADSVADHADEQYRSRTVEFARGISDATLEIDESLDAEDVTVFDALVMAVRYDDSWQLYAARHLRDDASQLSAETERAFDDLVDALRLFHTAREHFKTVYLQRELTRFSQLTILCGLPAIAAAVLIALLYGDLGGATLSLGYYSPVVPFLATVVFLPVGLLASYILRTATLTRRTAATGPTLLKKRPDKGPFDVTYGETEAQHSVDADSRSTEKRSQ